MVSTEQIKARATVTKRRSIENRFRARATVTKRRSIEENFKVRAFVVKKKYNWFPYVKARAKVKPRGLLSSMYPRRGDEPAYIIPSFDELDAFITGRVFIQMPDLGIEKLIGYARSGELYYRWGMNKEIYWELELIDFDREFIAPGSEWSGLFTEGIYSYSRKTRKFIKFEICLHVGKYVAFFILPRLVIKDFKGEYSLFLSGIDEISEIITQEIDLPTFCAREALGRINDKQFMVNYLTHKDYFDPSKRSELYVNYDRVTSGFTYNPSTKIVTFNNSIDEHYVVLMVNPVSKKWAINNICRQCVDKFPGKVTKEYFTVKMNFKKDTFFYSELTTQDVTPRDTIDKVKNSIPADYLIIPNNNKLEMVFMDVILGNEYPKKADVVIPEPMFRGTPECSRSSVMQNNIVDIQRYSAVYDAAQSMAATV